MTWYSCQQYFPTFSSTKELWKVEMEGNVPRGNICPDRSASGNFAAFPQDGKHRRVLVSRVFLLFMGIGNAEEGTHLWGPLLVHFCRSGT